MEADYAVTARSPVGSDDIDIPVIKVLDTDGQLVDTITSQDQNSSESPESKATVFFSPATSPIVVPSPLENSDKPVTMVGHIPISIHARPPLENNDKPVMVPPFPGPIPISEMIDDRTSHSSHSAIEAQLYSPKLSTHPSDPSSPGSPRSGLNAQVNRHRRTISLTSQDGSTMSDSSSDNFSVKSITPFSSDTRRPSSASAPNLRVTQSKWIVDSSTGRTISKLPNTIQTSCWDAFGNSVAFGTITGRIFVLHFPYALLSSAETRADGKRKTREWEDDHAFRHKPIFMRSRSSSDAGMWC